MSKVPIEEQIEEVIKEEKKIEEMLEKETKVMRWGAPERFEHHSVIGLTLALIITGLPLLNIGWFGWLLLPPTNVDLLRLIHRLTAGLLIFLALFHIFYHSFALRKTRILVSRKDVRDTVSLFKYYFGLTSTVPKMGFHNPTEKILVYWIMSVWFMLFMGVSGIMLLYPSSFPAWAHGWALVIHDVFFYLIVGVLIAHFYMTVLYKDYRPLLEGIFTTGLISMKFIKEHHLDWHEEILKRQE